MITAITLENFKGISNAATIPLRPLTIMFGKNSAGKSTVVQALHYAREIFERNNLNADRTLLGGSSVDLGGFRNLVNNHDDTKAITMRFEMDLREMDLPDYDFSPTLAYKAIRNEVEEGFYSEEAEKREISFRRGLDMLSSRTQNAAIELKIDWSELLQRPILTSYKTLFNEIEAVQVLTSADEKNIRLEYNTNHPLLFANEVSPDSSEVDWQPIEINAYEKSLPEKGKVLVLVEGTYEEYGDFDDIRLTQMLVGPSDLLREWLASFRYIGPLRATPPRNFQPTLTENESDWANGLAAWRELYNDKGLAELLVSGEWLSKTGYRFELNHYREISLESDLMIALESNNAFDKIGDTAAELKDNPNKYPVRKKLVLIEDKSDLEIMPHDIGIGISQVIPVVVAAFASNDRIIAIEQPELHLHPALQSELGDLFIQSALGDFSNFFLIETHSEHLILRILRRIRETTRGKAEIQITPENVSLLYVGEVNKQTDFLNLRIDKNGRIIDRVPGGFFEEDFAEIF